MSETRRVRIAVAIKLNGEWTSCGWSDAMSDATDEILRESAIEALDAPCIVHFIEAEIPMPEEKTIQAEVKE